MRLWNRTPLSGFLLFFCGGILFAFYLPAPGLHWLCIGYLMLLAFLIWYSAGRGIAGQFRLRWIAGFGFFGAVFLSGAILTRLKSEKELPLHFRNAANAECWFAYLTEPPAETSSGFKTRLQITGWRKDGKTYPGMGKCVVYLRGKKPADLKYGDGILFTARPREVAGPANPSQFDYRSWLSLLRIYDQVLLSEDQWHKTGVHDGWWIQGFAFDLRKKFLNLFSVNGIKGQDFGVLSALILGYEEDIDKETVAAYAASGAMHILSVSGLHVGIIYLALNFLLGFLDSSHRKKIIKAMILILFLWFYALLTGCSPSVTRSAAMFSFVLIGKLTRPQTSLFNTLSASAFVLLAINPYLLFQVGFQLSYAAVTGILILQPAIHSWVFPGYWLGKQLWSILSVSMAAQIATFPLGLFYFHQFPVYFLLTNVIVIPLSTMIIYGGVILIGISFVNPVAAFLGQAVGFLVHCMNDAVLFIEQLPFSAVRGITLSATETFLVYAVICFWILFFKARKAVWLLTGVVVLTALLFVQILHAWKNAATGQFIVYSIRGKSVWNFIDGRSNYLLSDTTVSAIDKSLQFSVVPYWRKCGLSPEQVEFIPGPGTSGTPVIWHRNIIRYRDLKIAVVRNASDLPAGKAKVDLVLLCRNPHVSVGTLLRHFDFQQLVIDPSNTARRQAFWQEESARLHVEAYSVLQQGAFVFSFAGQPKIAGQSKKYDKAGTF